MRRGWLLLPLVWAICSGCSGGDSRPRMLSSDATRAGGTQFVTPGASGAKGGKGTAGHLGGATDLGQVKLWAEQVSLSPAFGGSGLTCSRWVSSPSLSVIQDTANDRADLDQLVPELSSLMAPLEIVMVGDGDASANIEVFFAPLSSFDAIAASNAFPYVASNWGYAYTYWNADNQLQKAYVLLATDVLSGDALRHFTLEETAQSLGLSNGSAIFPDSVFYAEGADSGAATELSALDAHLVEFFYSDVAPGDGTADFDTAFDTSW